MRILITGATGTLGRHLVSTCIEQGHTPVAMSRSYSNLLSLPDKCIVHAGDVSDYRSICHAVQHFEVDTIIHAAANKHIHQCEKNPIDAIQTNIVGTHNILHIGETCPDVKRVLFVSSDKACCPSSVYGMSKRISEEEVRQYAARNSGKFFNSVRFGNLIGSDGSVVRIWERLLKQRTPPILHTNSNGTDILKFMVLPKIAAEFCFKRLNNECTGKTFIHQSKIYSIRTLMESMGISDYREQVCASYEKEAEALFCEEESRRISLELGEGPEWDYFVLHEPQNVISKHCEQILSVYTYPPESLQTTIELIQQERAQRL